MKKGLGKGLAALLPEDSDLKIIEKNENNQNEIIEIKINQIEPNKNQPRKNFDDEKLLNLAESIKSNGIIQPIIVKKENEIYRIIAGERRWRAARLAGLTHVPVIIKDMSDKKLLETALIENIQREDLNPIEEAEAYEKLINEYNMTQEQLSQIIGKSRPAITNTLRLLNLDDKIKSYIISGEITSGHARALVALQDKEMQLKIAEEIIKNDLSVRDTEKLVKKLMSEKKTVRKTKNDLQEEYINIEDRLKHILGTKVRLMHGKNKGKILIEYYSDEELDRLLTIMENGVK